MGEPWGEEKAQVGDEDAGGFASTHSMNVVSFPTRLNPTQSLSCLGVLSHN
jgi:hypothetical protein